ncbi:endonuclease V [Planctomycetota bacterium]
MRDVRFPYIPGLLSFREAKFAAHLFQIVNCTKSKFPHVFTCLLLCPLRVWPSGTWP